MSLWPQTSDAWWTSIAMGAAWKSAVVLILAGMIVIALRRSAAAARHLVWTLALLGTLMLPVLTAALPSWSWAIIPGKALAKPPEIKGAKETAGSTFSIDQASFDAARGSDGTSDDLTQSDRTLVTHSDFGHGCRGDRGTGGSQHLSRRGCGSGRSASGWLARRLFWHDRSQAGSC